MTARRAVTLDLTPALSTQARDGVLVPAAYRGLRLEVARVRRSVALCDCSHVVPVRVSGVGAGAYLARALPCELELRSHQARLTLLLDDGARPIADVTVVRDGDDLILLIDGLLPETVLEALGKPPSGVDVVPMHDTHALLTIDGPFAWELLVAYDRPGVIGLPYLSSYRPTPSVLCVRCGRCGEFGYELLVPRAEIPQVWGRLMELGEPLEVEAVGRLAREYCGLENHYFDAHREGRSGLTAIELQLQWRLSRRSDFRGAEALAQQRLRGPEHRVAGVRCEGAPAVGDPISFDGRPIGRVIAVADSLHGDGRFGLAALETAWSYSGIDRYAALHDGESVAIRTVSPPFVVNASLSVDPRKHDYQSWRSAGRD